MRTRFDVCRVLVLNNPLFCAVLPSVLSSVGVSPFQCERLKLHSLLTRHHGKTFARTRAIVTYGVENHVITRDCNKIGI